MVFPEKGQQREEGSLEVSSHSLNRKRSSLLG